MNPPINHEDLQAIISSLLAESKCACHIINPHKTRILMWKELQEDQEIYHLRIGIQKFTSQAQKDRNGEIYWRYWKKEVEESTETHDTQPANEQSSQHS